MNSALSTLDLWSLVIGFLSPLVIAIIQRPKWKQEVRATVTFLFCVLLGLGNVFFNGELDQGGDIVRSVLIVFVAAITAFHGLWQKLVTKKIELATTPESEKPVSE